MRAVREGERSFVRSGWLSVSAILTTSLALFVIGLAAVQAIATNSILKNLENKMDITVSFEAGTSEGKILAIKKELEKYREVKTAVYTSEDEALETFRKRSELAGNKEIIEQALEEIGGNPLLPSISIKASSPSDYETINRALETSSFKDDIFRINYRENESVINRLASIREEAVRQGAILGVIFLLIAFLVMFNTIRLTMHARHEDFEIMRLVGASNLYVRTPSVVEGILYGGIAAIVSLFFLYSYISFQRANPMTSSIVEGTGLMGSFLSNVASVFLGLLFVGVFVGALSGFLAVRRYLRI